MEKKYKKTEKLIVKLAKKSAESEVNSACCFLGYQSTIPKEAKSLRKF